MTVQTTISRLNTMMMILLMKMVKSLKKACENAVQKKTKDPTLLLNWDF